MIEAVIFDFDGVIADTMGDNCKAWQVAFAVHGFQLDSSEYYHLEGMGRFQIAQYFIETYQLDPAIKDEVVKCKEYNYKKNNNFRYFDYVNSIFSLLNSKRIPIGIVTGASTERIKEHLDKSMSASLTALITADDVTNTKPHPEPYLKAVNMIGKPPENCIVVENAILGIKAAKAAGCCCFALETTLKANDLSEADRVFPTHKDLLNELESLLN
jgi:beta-phosphoglucomutase